MVEFGLILIPVADPRRRDHPVRHRAQLLARHEPSVESGRTLGGRRRYPGCTRTSANPRGLVRRDRVAAAVHRVPEAPGCTQADSEHHVPARTTQPIGDPVKVDVSSPYTFRAIMKLGTITSAARTTMRLDRRRRATPRVVHSDDMPMRRMSRSHRTLGERGQVAVLFALMLPMLLALGGVVIGVGNWYVHGKNLQTKADAGAFAGGGSGSFRAGRRRRADRRTGSALRRYRTTRRSAESRDRIFIPF